jgi:hypothetical protein
MKKRTVRQVGYLQKLNRDARSAKQQNTSNKYLRKTMYRLLRHEKIFTYQNESADGEGIINGAAMTKEEGHGGRIKFTSLTLKFADWLYFLNKPQLIP